MIQKFVEMWEKNKGAIRSVYENEHPTSYSDVVKIVIANIADADDYVRPDVDRIHEIDDGDYQGTLFYVIASTGYQPSDYWFVKVYYGSCSGCDTLQGISGYNDKPPTTEQVDQYMTLSLHIVQGLKVMEGEGV